MTRILFPQNRVLGIGISLILLISVYVGLSFELYANNDGNYIHKPSQIFPLKTTNVDGIFRFNMLGSKLSLNDDLKNFELKKSLPSCDNGSSPFSIYSVDFSNGTLTFIFNASNLSQGKWKIFKDTTVIANGVFSPTSNTINLSVGSLASNTYNFVIEGVSCTGSASKSFTVNNTTPPPPPPTVGISCNNGSTPFSVLSIAYNQGKTTFEVNANNFSSAKWSLYQDTTLIRNANFSVTNNIMTLNTGAITEGNYTFQLDGVSCDGRSRKNFRVATPFIPESTITVAPCNTDNILFVVTGESNAGGRALNTELSSLELTQRDSLKILNNENLNFESLKVGENNLLGHFTLINGTTHGLEVAIANRVRQQTFYNKKAYLLKAGQGKSLVTDWDTSGVYFKSLVTRIKAAKQNLVSSNVSYKTVILYSQGINDLLSGVSSVTWKANTKIHFQNLRNELGENTPIIMTKFMPQYSGYNGVIDEICSELTNTYSVDTWDAGLADDKHWNANGLKLIGERMLTIVERFNFASANRSATASSSALVNVSPASLCEGSSQLLTAIANNGGNAPLFQWYKNNEALPFFTNKFTSDGLGNNLVNSVAVLNDNQIYVGTAKGLSISTDGGNTFTNRITNGKPSSNSIRGVAVSSSGVIYVATAFDGVNISTDGGVTFSSKKTAQGLTNNNTRGIAVDANGKIYVATMTGLSISTDGGNSFSSRNANHGLPSNSIQCVFVGSDGKIYAGTSSGGIGISSDGGNHFNTYNTNNGLGDDNVFNIYVSNTGKIYAATAFGLSISNDGGNHFSNITTSNGLGDDYVYCVAVSPDNRIFAGTYGGGLSISNDGGVTFNNYTIGNGLGDDRVRAMAINSTGKLFVGTTGSLSIGNQNIYNVTNAKANDNYSVSMSTICPITKVSTASFVISPAPSLPTVADKAICSGTTTTLSGTCSVGSLIWYSSDTSTTPLGTDTYTTDVIAANTDFYATCQSGSCTSNRVKLTVTASQVPANPVVNNQNICSGNNTTLSAYCATGVVTWYASATDTIRLGVNNFGTPILTESANYYVSCNLPNLSCNSSRLLVAVNVSTTPPSPTTANTTICKGSTTLLTATCLAGVATWFNSTNSTSALASGTYTTPALTTNTDYYVECKVTNNVLTCNSVRTKITVTVNDIPTTPTGNGMLICYNTTASLTATCLTGTQTWYSGVASETVLGSGSFTTPALTTTTDYYVSCESGGTTNCRSSRLKVTVTVNPMITPPVGLTNQSVYAGNTIALQATGCTGTGFSVKWYESTNNTLVQLPVAPTATKSYYAKCEQVVNSLTCASLKSTDISLTVIRRVFVDSTKVSATTQDGNTWATAYGNLVTGLASASSGIEVWVAKGTYKPTTTNTRTISFTVPSGVKVYGGFAGTETLLTQRNANNSPSILSGEIGDLGVNTDNSYHVVTFDATDNNTVLDGFIITGGNANFTSITELSVPYTATTTATDNTGGGIVVKNTANPTISNCTIKLNSAKVGGGIFCANGSFAKILSCKVIGNIASIGGAIYTQQNSNIWVKNAQISGNKGNGEAFYNNSTTPLVVNCTIVGSGGSTQAVYNGTSSPSIFQNCIIWGYTNLFNDTQSSVSYSNLSGDYAGVGNSNTDPLFVSALPVSGSVSVAGNFHLTSVSPMIDGGSNTFVSTTDKDIEQNTRIFGNGRVDVGAFEFQGSRTGGTITSIKTGNWEDGSTWDAGRKPYAGDVVIISTNHIISINSIGIAKTIQYGVNTSLKFMSSSTGLQIGI
ncbi:Ig-like domain-containing protein [Arcicella aurantiaca]|nr:sialate O-acetylesterase [Arcicella aurantiaca]